MRDMEHFYQIGVEPINVVTANEYGVYEVGDRFTLVRDGRVTHYEVVSDEEWEAL